MLATKVSVHLLLLNQLVLQLKDYQHQHHLWRMRAMGIIDSLSSTFLCIPVDESDKLEILETLYQFRTHPNVSLAISELQRNERRPEVNRGGKPWEPIHDMICHCDSNPMHSSP